MKKFTGLTVKFALVTVGMLMEGAAYGLAYGLHAPAILTAVLSLAAGAVVMSAALATEGQLESLIVWVWLHQLAQRIARLGRQMHP